MQTAVVIEDSARVREIAVGLLADLGFMAYGTGTVEDGLAKMEEVKPDLCLLDWDLPKLGALDVLKGAAETMVPRPRTVLMATENDPKQFTLARAAGASSYILKPFDRRDFARALTQAGVELNQGAA
ncbi:MAG: response regulator [Pseudomonadota bacterium]